jgi:hypothetical protein
MEEPRFRIIGVFYERTACLDGEEGDVGDLVRLLKRLTHVDPARDPGDEPRDPPSDDGAGS